MEFEQTITPRPDETAALLNRNAESLVREINWFVQCANNRLTQYFPNETVTEKPTLPVEEKLPAGGTGCSIPNRMRPYCCRNKRLQPLLWRVRHQILPMIIRYMVNL